MLPRNASRTVSEALNREPLAGLKRLHDNLIAPDALQVDHVSAGRHFEARHHWLPVAPTALLDLFLRQAGRHELASTIFWRDGTSAPASARQLWPRPGGGIIAVSCDFTCDFPCCSPQQTQIRYLG